MSWIISTVKTAFGYGLEYPNYQVIKTLANNVEIRKYDAAKWACVLTEGQLNDESRKSSQMFRKLFNYISGQNDLNEKIQMTVPVTVNYKSENGEKIDVNSDCKMEMGFFVPRELNDKTPNPTGENMRIRADSDLIFACVQFGGYLTTPQILKNRDIIVDALGPEAINYDTVNFVTAGYNSPFQPFFRRNEIWLRKIN